MKNYCVIHILLFLLLMLVYQCTHAQDYLVTTKGDTIKGDIKPLTYGSEKKVQITTAGKKRTTVPLFQVKSYSFKNEIYQPVKGDKGYTFMKLIKGGYLSLYAFQLENQVTYDGMYLAKRDGSGLEVPNLTFKKIMTRFLGDCPSVSQKIDDGQLAKKNLLAIVDEYNQCITNKTAELDKSITQNQIQSKKISAWDTLEEKIRSKEFENKNDALEMISDIKGKIKRDEKIPNFLLEGLKNSLAQAGLTEEYNNALKEIKN